METLYSPDVVRRVLLGYNNIYGFRPLKFNHVAKELFGHVYINLDTPTVDIPCHLIPAVINKGLHGHTLIAPYFIQQCNRHSILSHKNAVMGGLYALSYYNDLDIITRIKIKDAGSIYLSGVDGVFDNDKKQIFGMYIRCEQDRKGKLTPVGAVAKFTERILAKQNDSLYKVILKFILPSIVGTDYHFSFPIANKYQITRLFNLFDTSEPNVHVSFGSLPVSVEFLPSIPGFELPTKPSPLFKDEDVCHSILASL